MYCIDTTEKLAGDYEIQQFRTELVTPIERGGAGIAVCFFLRFHFYSK